jgi:hypothetical protein
MEKKILSDNHLGVLNDLCKANLEMNMNSFARLIEYLKSNPYFSRIKLAVICDTPGKIVFPLLGEYKVRGLKIRPFTTLETAIDWILEG